MDKVEEVKYLLDLMSEVSSPLNKWHKRILEMELQARKWSIPNNLHEQKEMLIEVTRLITNPFNKRITKLLK